MTADEVLKQFEDVINGRREAEEAAAAFWYSTLCKIIEEFDNLDKQ
jgi:hypothetical protein